MKNSIIKTVVLTIALLTTSTLVAQGKGEHKGGGHKAGLVKLPHPMKALLPNLEEFKVDKEQKAKIDKILEEVPSKMHTLMDEASSLEHSIRKRVVKGKKSFVNIENDLNKLQTLKREISTIQIKTINRLQKILSDAQYSSLIMKLKASKQCK